MVRFSVAALLVSLTTAGAFAPAGQTRAPARPLSAAAVETPPSPLTIWGEKISDIAKLQADLRKQDIPEFGPEISSADVGIASDDTEAQLHYFKENAMDLKQKLQAHGAIVFRGFDLMKTNEGFQEFYKAVGMKVCQDPLQAVSARPTADGKKDSPVYEAVNKESRKNFFIGELFDSRHGFVLLLQNIHFCMLSQVCTMSSLAHVLLGRQHSFASKRLRLEGSS
jgi:hypothetical protein